MSRPLNTWRLLLLFWLFFGGVLWLQDGLVLTSHWGDALHLIDILERVAGGQRPHQDFVTPIGALAFLPIAILMEAGLPTGQAIFVAQFLLSGLFSACALAVAKNRVAPGWDLAFALCVLVTTISVAHGVPESSLSINVHYNRWAWSIALVAALTALLAGERFFVWEGLLIGAAMASLALIKVTYFVAFLPLVIIGLLLTRQVKLLALAAVTGVLVAILMTFIWGVAHWDGYAADLLFVSSRDSRPDAGAGIVMMLVGPLMWAPTVLALCAVIVLSLKERKREALLLVCAYIAGAYVSDQNAGHDPLFLALLALLVLTWMHSLKGDQKTVLLIVAAGLLLTVAPNLTNMASSPFRAAMKNRSDFVPLLTVQGRHQDILLARAAAQQHGQVYFDSSFFGVEPEIAVFKGHPLPDCQSILSVRDLAVMAQDLEKFDSADGAAIFVADFLSPLWLFGEWPPLQGGAPWNYGGLHGIENAEFVLVPHCPNRPAVHRDILSNLDETRLTEVHRTDHFRLFEMAD